MFLYFVLPFIGIRDNCLQDGKSLPNGPVVISPDGLFPSLYREGEVRYSLHLLFTQLPTLISIFPSSSLQEYMHPLLKSEINVVRFPSNKKSPSRIQNRLFGGKC